jgi:hypothetical protein
MFSDALLAEVNEKGWTVVSMKDDWNTIFPNAAKQPVLKTNEPAQTP